MLPKPTFRNPRTAANKANEPTSQRVMCRIARISRSARPSDDVVAETR